MIEIRSLKLDRQVPDSMLEVARQCFGPEFIQRQILQTTWRHSPPKTRVYAAYQDDKLLAFNFFLAHQSIIDGASRVVFQSCHSGTSTVARGRGLFRTIINHAKSELAQHGDFIVGFPNNQSEPIFVNKLGFNLSRLTRIYAPCAPAGLSKALFDANLYANARSDRSLVRIDQHSVSNWKQAEHPGNIFKIEYATNLIWGRCFERIVLGKRLVLFDAGGCEINEPRLLKETLEVVRQRHGVSLVRFVCTSDSPLGRAWLWPLGGDKTEPLIWFPLNSGIGMPKFDVYTGLKDVY